MRRIVLAAAMFGGALVLPVDSASAGTGVNFEVGLPEAGYVDDFVIDLENTGQPCSDTTVEVLDDSSTVVSTVALADSGTDDAGTVLVPDSIAFGDIMVRVTCEAAGGPYEQTFPASREYAALDVTKVVEGDPAAGTTYTVRVDCSGSDAEAAAGDDTAPYDLVFATAGGTDRVWFFDAHSCDVSETDDGGAESSSVESTDCLGGEGSPAAAGPASTVEIDAPVICTAEFTNVFPEAVDDNVVAPPAQPAPVAPSFTG